MEAINDMIIGRNSTAGSYGKPSHEVFPSVIFGPFIYRKNKLVQALYDGGCVTMTDNTPQFRFYQNDHLGSVRAVVSSTGQPSGAHCRGDAADDSAC